MRGHGAWLGWTDGRARQAQAASGELRAEIDGSAAAAAAWLTRHAGTSKAGQTNGRADGQANGPN